MLLNLMEWMEFNCHHLVSLVGVYYQFSKDTSIEWMHSILNIYLTNYMIWKDVLMQVLGRVVDVFNSWTQSSLVFLNAWMNAFMDSISKTGMHMSMYMLDVFKTVKSNVYQIETQTWILTFLCLCVCMNFLLLFVLFYQKVILLPIYIVFC